MLCPSDLLSYQITLFQLSGIDPNAYSIKFCVTSEMFDPNIFLQYAYLIKKKKGIGRLLIVFVKKVSNFFALL